MQSFVGICEVWHVISVAWTLGVCGNFVFFALAKCALIFEKMAQKAVADQRFSACKRKVKVANDLHKTFHSRTDKINL